MKTKHARRIRYWILAAREDWGKYRDTENRKLRTQFVSRKEAGPFIKWPRAYTRIILPLLVRELDTW